MDDKIKGTVSNICTILGGALLLYPLIDEAAKTLAPELDKLTSGEYQKQLSLLTDGKEHKDHDCESHKKEPDMRDSEIEELKKKIAEYEEKEQSKHKESDEWK